MKGFAVRRLKIHVDKDVKLTVAEYSLSLRVRQDEVSLRAGWNVVDLSQYDDIVAFKLGENSTMLAEVVLEP